ncbi:DUF1697 domain-containing protein [Alcaligenes nematophilus]|uniref:DUF1697 domain-containing protein n=1 Tax=Alcaligenes nematophilus TaxID=2994643 RepID=UPI0034E0BD6A
MNTQILLLRGLMPTGKNKLGGDIQVIARTPAYFMRMMANNPFKDESPSQLYFTLLRSPADSALLHAFHALEHAPDQVRIIDDIVYIVCATRYRDLKANNNFIEKRKLKVVATTRNFTTMSKLIALSTGNEIMMNPSS